MYTRLILLASALLALAGCASTAPHSAKTPANCPANTMASKQVAAPLPVRFDEGRSLSADDLRADFDTWMDGLKRYHPDLAVRAEMAEFARVRDQIRHAIRGPMSQREAYLLFARLETTFNDAHNGIRMPDTIQAWLDSGHAIFPLNVEIGANLQLRVRQIPQGAEGFGIAAGDRIVSINGQTSASVVSRLMEITGSDTLESRAAILTRRFQRRFLQVWGDTGNYALEFERKNGCRYQALLPGARTLLPGMQNEPAASEIFQYSMRDDGIAYLKVSEFFGPYRAQLAAFAKTAFTDIRAKQARALIIDVRENGGGDDPLWQESLMEYITDKTYTHVGSFAVKVNEDNADPGDVIGEVQRKVNKKRFTPSANQPLRFKGPVYLLSGPFSYSATVQFLVAAQDFGIAKIAGDGTGALSCQTGKIKFMKLPKTGLNAFTPIIAFTRPSGKGCAQPIVPDVRIDHSNVDPQDAVEQLARKIRGE